MLQYSPLFYKKVEANELPQIQSMYSREEHLLSDISISDEGKMIISGVSYTPTEQCIKNLSSVLRIPYPFVCQIPVDLLQKNVNTLKGLGDRPSYVVFRKEKDQKIPINIFANSNPDVPLKVIKELPCDELLDQFASEGVYIKRAIRVGDLGLCFDVLNEDLGRLNLNNFKVGDFASLGYRIYNPFTLKSNSLFMKFMGEQYSCSNGMTFPTSLGIGASLSLTNDLGDTMSYFDNFNRSINESIGKKFLLKDFNKIFDNMQETPIKYRFLMPLINKFKPHPELFKHIFTLNSEAPMDSDSAELKFYAKQAVENENGDSTYNYMDVLYKMTEFRTGFEEHFIEEVENYTSTLISAFIKQLTLLN